MSMQLLRGDESVCTEVIREGKNTLACLDGVDCYEEPCFAELQEQGFYEVYQSVDNDGKNFGEILRRNM